jgi:hypothetical protein
VRYACFGLVVDSALDLPALAVAPPDLTPDVTVRTGVLGGPPPDAVHPVPGLWCTDDRCGLTIEGVARYEARRGRDVVVDADPAADPEAVRLFVLGTMMGAILMQRGHLVLHGNAFATGDDCTVVAGHSGAGKSTLAAEMHRRGLPVLSDDVVPVDDAGRALPGYPRIKLWADALQRLGVPTTGLARVYSDHEKFELPLDRYAGRALPVRAVYALALHDGPLTLVPARGIDAFRVLVEHTYRRELVHGPAGTALHLRRCAQLAARARVVRVLRPRDVAVGQTAEAVLADLAEHPSGPTRRESA